MISLRKLRRIAGIEINPVSHTERLVSVAGGFVSILIVYLISRTMMGGAAPLFLVASMGASAVLLFASPHTAFAQPWNLVGGHFFSAIIGVACVLLIGTDWLSAALAVAIAIGVMHYLRCIHPPGGATALTAVLAGPLVEEMGFMFVLLPVMLNTAVILIIAVGFNGFFKWRRYPAALYEPLTGLDVEDPYADITHADFVAALAEIDTFIDVSEQDLLRIYALVTRREVTDTRSGTDQAEPNQS